VFPVPGHRGRILSKAGLQPSIEPYVSLSAPSNLADLQTARGEVGRKDEWEGGRVIGAE